MIIFDLKRAADLNMSTETQVDLIDFMASYTILHAMVPGKVESYNFVMDLNGLGITEAPISMLKEATSRLKKGYKMRVHNLIVINADWKIKYAANFIYNFIPARLTDKIKVFSDNGKSHFATLASKDRL